MSDAPRVYSRRGRGKGLIISAPIRQDRTHGRRTVTASERITRGEDQREVVKDRSPMRLHRSSDVADVEFDYPEYRDEDEAMADFEMDEVVVDVTDGSSRPRRHAPSNEDDDDDDDDADLTWILTEPAPGGPAVIDLIPSFKTHVAYDIWNGIQVV